MSISTARAGRLLVTTILTAAATAYLHGAAGVPARAGSPAPKAAPAPAPSAETATEVKAVVDKYCISCHSERLKTAGLVLEKHDIREAAADPETWERVVRKLRARAMPPSGSPRPDAA